MQNATQHNSDQTRFLKIYDIIGNRSKGIPPLLPICRTTFLQRVKDLITYQFLITSQNTGKGRSFCKQRMSRRNPRLNKETKLR